MDHYFVIDNRNMKGRILLSGLSQNILRLANRYFNKPSFVAWISLSASISPHMLDVITTSVSFFKNARDCGVKHTGMRSDHYVVKLIFSNRPIKFNSTYVERPVIDWKCIQDFENTNQLLMLICNTCSRRT